MDREKFEDILRVEIGKLLFIVRITSNGRIFMGVEDVPRRQQGVFGKEAVVALFQAIWDGKFEKPPLQWDSFENSAIEWWFTGSPCDDKSQIVLCKPDGYRLWLTIAEFRVLVGHLKQLLERPGEAARYLGLPEAVA